ncbi:MAG TPA: GAF domain-containing protein [Hypericibacter adhaerens]|jgi:DNA-binding PucR family transcriptional regulator|uniref:Cyclic diguanylate phosphodiesterase n=1 Tax=Hypericibacter adhaerens TaxID=2602016 RepID=A0A5J6MSS7_9PROT|nr:GAF domain-containing protein [Hypericibacter adhaerens]QEX20638.1 cyclic diguanylate phosphodiesterase [Hypericibacter adhaerens]HWA45103.1 GAF domain-containing protein [Hypericibacter adhaerens]
MGNPVAAVPLGPFPNYRAEQKTYRQLLQLLDDNAPLSSFDRVVTGIREAVAAGSLPQSMLKDIAIAVRLRENFEHKRKREVELSALYETARDLSALRDTDQVLQAIVQRAKQLVGSDIAYLSAADEERDDFYVRATEGVVSADFARIRVSRSVGVCGGVARTRRPFYSNNYLVDHQFDHDAFIDGAIQSEGIVSILGIPLEIEAHVIGVLFVGDRYVRSYTPQEMAALSSLGTFAALAIENARLLEEAQRALRMAKLANAALKAKADAVEEAATAHEQLTELIARGGTLDDLTSRVSKLLRGQAAVIDDRRKLVSGTLPEQATDEQLAKAVRESCNLGRSVPLLAAEDTMIHVAATTGGPARLGALVFTRKQPLSDSEIRTLERSAIVTGIVLLSMERVAQTAYRNVADAVSALLRGTTDPLSAGSGRQLPQGMSVTWPLTVMLVEINDLSAMQASSVARTVLPGRDTIFAEYNGDLAVVTSNPHPDQLADRLWRKLDEAFGQPVSIVISDRIPAIDRVRSEYEALRRGLALLRGLKQQGRVVFEKTLSLYALVFSDREADALDGFVTASVGRIVEHDRKRGSQLAATLLAYLDNGRHIQKAADALGIHVNTMRQRLAAIGELSPDSIDPARSLEVHMALRLRSLARPE